MATANDRVFDKLDQLAEGMGEVKREIAAGTMQIEQLANHQREANHRTQKAEDRIAALEAKNAQEALAGAYVDGVKAGMSGMLISKKRALGIIAVVSGAAGALSAAIDIAWKVLS